MTKRFTRALIAVAALAAPAAVPAAATQAPPRPAVEPIPAPPDVAAVPEDATKLAGGLAYKVLSAPSDRRTPTKTDLVTVNYTGWTTDGKMFDSSYARKKPSTFPLDRVIPGWTEGVSTMSVGEKRRWWIPESLAYKGAAGRPAGMLVFEIELIDTQPNPATPPADVAAPPADARKTPSGLAYKVLRPGQGGLHPKSSSRVTVHYTGWTTDGKMFDSSVMRGSPATFPLDQVIRGWTEGVQLMTIGEKTRFWIPQGLAYKGEPGSPKGMLVFEIELLKIE